MAAGDDLAQMAQLVNDLKACFSADSTWSAMYVEIHSAARTIYFRCNVSLVRN